MPAVFAEITPAGESSTARQRAGLTPRRRAAARYTSGAGLPCGSSSAVQRTSTSRARRAQTASIRRIGEEDAMASRSPDRWNRAIASGTPGIGSPARAT
jgi:hypothetical protein